MADTRPPLIRPIPRRPFQAKVISPTPPQEDKDSEDNDDDDYAPNPNANLSVSRFLDFFSPPASALSRPQSGVNINGSTLFGIYSPTTNDDADTPWGTGAHTPIKRPSVDERLYELMKERSSIHRRCRSSQNSSAESSALPEQTHGQSMTTTIGVTVAMILRALLLFALGVGYGMCLTRLQNSSRWPSTGTSETLTTPGSSWRYLIFWGIGGMILGAILPWFDGVWDHAFSGSADEAVELPSDVTSTPTDWALVMRAIGAFVGIIFAIRKLAWASTLQVSIALALVNPLLWWLIDRSQAGFILSAGVGVAGSALLLGVNPEMMPSPSGLLHHGRISYQGHHHVPTNNSGQGLDTQLAFGGFANQELVETGMWMLSVLFCSCLCFGNIGRRLAWSKSAVGRGRWGGVR